MRNVTFLLAVALLFGFGTANASVPAMSPRSACALLNNAGLSGRSWRHLYQNKYGCSSPYKNIGAGFPLANNLAYYVDGTKSSVTKLYLVLNLNNKSQASSARSALLKVSEMLSQKLDSAKLPTSIKNAILAGKSRSGKIGRTVVKVQRMNWPTGKGYEIHVTFK